MRPFVFTFALSLMFASCGNDAERAAADETAEKPAPGKVQARPVVEDENTEQKPAAKPKPRVKTETYMAELAASTESNAAFSTGKRAQLLVTIRPQNGWHMNHEFPTSVTVKASEAVQPEKSKIEKKDATRFDDEGADFVVPVSLNKGGKQDVVADLSFAVCTEQTCLPENLQLALTLDIASPETAP